MIELIRKRRSIRKYSRKKIDPTVVNLLTEAVRLAPSSRDIRPRHYVFVNDPVLLKQLSRCKENGAAFLANAPLGIVVCGDETRSDVWIEDCSIAAILVQMAGLSCGLGSCWIQIRNRKTADNRSSERYIQELLAIPAHLRVESIIALGYPAEKKYPVRTKKKNSEKIHINAFGSR